MVDDRLRDGTRIAELLASELTGLDRGGLSALSVTDAVPDAEASAAGTLAYHVSYEGRKMASVSLLPEAARVAFVGEVLEGHSLAEVITAPERAGLTLLERDSDGEAVRIESGAAVKPAVDLIADVVAARADND